MERLLGVVPIRGEVDRVMLAIHTTMLEHGFICTGCGEVGDSPSPALATNGEGQVVLVLVPNRWNASSDTYSFAYIHPLRGAGETFIVKGVSIGGSLAVHAASSSPGADLLTLTVNISKDAADNDPASVAVRAKEWQEKAAGVAVRLLGRDSSTARLGRALEAQAESSGVGAKRPATEDRRSKPVPENNDDRPERWRPAPGEPWRDPFNPLFVEEDRRDLVGWLPGGGGEFVGPRHPFFRQVIVPGGRPEGGGMMPRFDPVGPGGGDPDPDHFQPGGFGPDGVPFRSGGRGGRMDPDGMFMM